MKRIIELGISTLMGVSCAFAVVYEDIKYVAWMIFLFYLSWLLDVHTKT